MENLSFSEKKALSALRLYGPIVCRRNGGRPFSQTGQTRLHGFSLGDVESLVEQGFAKRTQSVPDLVFHPTGPGFAAKF